MPKKQYGPGYGKGKAYPGKKTAPGKKVGAKKASMNSNDAEMARKPSY